MKVHAAIRSVLVAVTLLTHPGTPPLAQGGTAVIRGQVLAADTGRPLRRVRVSLTTLPAVRGAGRITTTDLNGRYELAGIAPGRYTVSAARDGFLTVQYGQRRPLELGRPLQIADSQIIENVDLLLPRTSVITGHIVDESGEPIANVSVFAMRRTYFEGRRGLLPVTQGGPGPIRTDSTGYYRIVGLLPGTYYVMATFRELWESAAGADPSFGYAPTYFPGTSAAQSARPISVGVGEETSATDFALVPGRTSTISGVAIDSRGRLLAGQRVEVMQEIRGLETLHAYVGGRAMIGADGTFAVENVPPGEYKVVASGGVDGQMEAAAVLLTLDGADVTGLVLRASAGWTLSGQVVDENGSTPRVQRGEVRIDGRTLTGGAMPARPPTSVRADADAPWTFTFAGLYGATRLRAVLPDGWAMKSVLRGTRDVTDALIEGGSAEDISDVRIVVTNRTTTVTGNVRDDKGAARDDGTVILFAEDRQKLFENSRWIATTRLDREGRFRIGGLPAGAYLAIAVDYVEDGLWNDPEYLESIRRFGQRVTLGEAGSQTVSLRLVTP